MRLDEFDYQLPPERIAQEPLARRDASRLMVIDRRTGATEHHRFSRLADLLRSDDLLVLNDARVFPARLRGYRSAPGASVSIELLLLKRLARDTPEARTQVWHVMMRGKARAGEALRFGSGLSAELIGPRRDEYATVRLRTDRPELSVEAAIDRVGETPLPPYIARVPDGVDSRAAADRERYQTVYARQPGAVAAPTAGLHFTVDLLAEIRARGVRIETLTLYVGPGTFLPVRVPRIEDHRLLPEHFELSPRLAEEVLRARERGGRVVVVGTTVTRVLEAQAAEGGGVAAGSGSCDLFIYPGHRFRVVDALITNFHLPQSTLLMLVSAFAGRERILAAYDEAIRERYRFYSYGDAMLLQ